jgi:Leucine-rich repeat (LRR) protein
MQGNKLTTVDACVGYLRELRSLYLKGNPLRKLALSIGALQNLHILSYDNAEGMTIPPCQVGKVGHIAVIEWLKIFYHNIVVQFRSELRKNFYTAKAAFNFFDKDRSGQLDKDEVSAALEYLNIDVKYFEYVWLTLDMNNNGVVEWFEFLHNFAANMDETVKDPYIDLKPFLPDEVIQQTAQLLCANPWQTTQFEKVVSI